MGSLSTYLVPATQHRSPSAYHDAVKRALLKLKIIRPDLYADHPNWYSAGPNSIKPFEHEDIGSDFGDDLGFEYCIIHGSQVELVPLDPAVEPRCPNCDANVSDEFFELVRRIEDQKKKGSSPVRVGNFMPLSL